MTSLSRLQITCIIILQKRLKMLEFLGMHLTERTFPEFVTNLAQLISDVIYLYKVTVKVHL